MAADPALIAQKNKRESSGSWIYLYSIGAGNGEFVFRVTSHDQSVTFDGNEYHPFPVTIGEISEDVKGSLPVVAVTVANVSREIASLLEHYNGMRNEEVEIRSVHTSNLAIPNTAPATTFTIESSRINASVCVFQLSLHPEVQEAFPFRKFGRSHCPLTFGEELCGWGYVPGLPGINPPGSVPMQTSCKKTFSYCSFLGGLYAAAGEIPIHPERFGGQQGIPRNG